MPFEPLTAISSVDGRYHEATLALSAYFSEYALIRYRVAVECEYLIALSKERGVGIRALTPDEVDALRDLSDVSVED
ncbi:MAG: adenylosuccinate lyase, partial [Candidatus Paceibacterota bacterium]